MRFLIKYKIALMALIAVLMSGSLTLALGLNKLEIEYVSISGNINKEQRISVQGILAKGELSLTDIEGVKATLDDLSWVRTVQVSQKWPDELAIMVEAEEPIAYWNDDAFINNGGLVFISEYLVAGDLPQLYGPVGSERQVMTHYQRLNRALAKAGQSIEVLSLNKRGSLEFEDRSGVLVALGNVDVEQRMKRYLQVIKIISADESGPAVKSVDTRYTNGVAVDFIKQSNGFEVTETFNLQREVSL